MDNIKRHDEVLIVRKSSHNDYVGFVDYIDNKTVTLHIYVPDIYVTFDVSDIAEIGKI